MRNREYFYREDYKTFKKKYLLFCREKRVETENLIEKYEDSLARLNNYSYIAQKQIKIIEL